MYKTVNFNVFEENLQKIVYESLDKQDKDVDAETNDKRKQEETSELQKITGKFSHKPCEKLPRRPQ